MKAVVAAFNQEKALVGAFSVLTNLRMELFQALVHILRPPSCGSSSSAPDGNKMPIWHSTGGDPLAVCPHDVPSGHSSHQWCCSAGPVSAWERGMGQGRAGDPPPPTQMDSSWGVKFRPAAAAAGLIPVVCTLYPQHQHQPRTRSALTGCYEQPAGK